MLDDILWVFERRIGIFILFFWLQELKEVALESYSVENLLKN